MAVATLLSVALYYSAYEVWHAVLHLPFDRFWRPRIKGRWMGAAFRRAYAFHLTHHWRPRANQAIVGFWGIALWDHAFRTHLRPQRLPLNGGEVNYDDAQLLSPLWPIRQLDCWQTVLSRASRTFERYLARTILQRKTEQSNQVSFLLTITSERISTHDQ